MNQNISNQLDALKDKFTKDVDGTWKLEEQHDAYTYHTRAHPQNEINITRFEGVVKGVEFSKLETVFSQLKSRSLVEPDFETKELVNDGNIVVAYGKGKPPIPGADPLDIVLATKVYKLGQGETLVVNSSVVHEAQPPVAGITRGEMNFNFTYLKQINPDEVQLLNVLHFDPKGAIPKELINKGGPQVFEGLKKLVEYARTH